MTDGTRSCVAQNKFALNLKNRSGNTNERSTDGYINGVRSNTDGLAPASRSANLLKWNCAPEIYTVNHKKDILRQKYGREISRPY